MGMYDTIVVADSLPWPEEALSLKLNTLVKDFQSKDLECAMEEYAIQGGRLFIKKWKESKWIEGDKNAKNVCDRFGYLERTGEYMEEVPHHGIVEFYDFTSDVDSRWDCWVVFKAIFNRGAVEGFELVEFRKDDNAERKAREKKSLEEYERQQNLWYNKYFLQTSIVFKIRRKISRLLHSFGQVLQTLSYKL